MINLFRYLSARRHLIEIDKTIDAMSEAASPIIYAQRDMTQDEVTYFFYKTVADIIYSLLFILMLITSYGLYDAI